jgi:hypothetical protein
MKMRGNHPKRKLRGAEGMLLVMYRIAYPKASADQISTFIFKCTGNVYSRKDVGDREKELGFSRKIGSVLAYQALEPRNLFKRQLFWTSGWPTGVVGVPRNSLWDIDEAGNVTLPRTQLSAHGQRCERVHVCEAFACALLCVGAASGGHSRAAGRPGQRGLRRDRRAHMCAGHRTRTRTRRTAA